MVVAKLKNKANTYQYLNIDVVKAELNWWLADVISEENVSFQLIDLRPKKVLFFSLS